LKEIESLIVDRGQIKQIETKDQFGKNAKIVGVKSKFLWL